MSSGSASLTLQLGARFKVKWRLCDFDRWLMAEAPAPRKPSGYLPIEDLPPKREIMPADEQLKLKNELIAARDRQAASNGNSTRLPDWGLFQQNRPKADRRRFHAIESS